ncbi:hypothetical protein ABZ816_09075 [Actinosynnema sp. NPDC047251]|uniref:hypothetical protein n=1 Tax=Saccharothrix espanaensis TaxID=103731 RepID=UPI00031E5D25|nr:hypothetical protein [Saccharothrix espanaensis]
MSATDVPPTGVHGSAGRAGTPTFSRNGSTVAVRLERSLDGSPANPVEALACNS